MSARPALDLQGDPGAAAGTHADVAGRPHRPSAVRPHRSAAWRGTTRPGRAGRGMPCAPARRVRAHLIADVPVGVLLSGPASILGALTALAAEGVVRSGAQLHRLRGGAVRRSRRRAVPRSATARSTWRWAPTLRPYAAPGRCARRGRSTSPSRTRRRCRPISSRVAAENGQGLVVRRGRTSSSAATTQRRRSARRALCRSGRARTTARLDRLAVLDPKGETDYRLKRSTRRRRCSTHATYKEIFAADVRAGSPAASASDPLSGYRERFADRGARAADPLAGRRFRP